ncbi:hypothetical protein RHMOL_RhmolUnG0011200 [Rhododendron molle]|nr:hypothetical protein RHMOL_RhmolUnG0011200 [Rhododendron molle]
MTVPDDGHHDKWWLPNRRVMSCMPFLVAGWLIDPQSTINCGTSTATPVWRSVLSDGPGPSPLEGGAREGETPVRTLSHHEALSVSRVVWECSPNRAVNSVQG